jgi:hypothetical protein
METSAVLETAREFSEVPNSVTPSFASIIFNGGADVPS